MVSIRSTRTGGVMKTLFGAIVLVCFILLLLVEIVTSGGTLSARTANESFKRLDVIPRDSHVDLNFMSKRKVPNGPDPIHNRRAGKSGATPGRA
ncbi:hypothetical protein IFM89_013355 [Coptis chinensis]|uniref:CLAVATA3/ESR (CLE)-related protein 25-like n=1 Tax=Coptis chinensis TaxID=261450 RepID=A0A835M388_9MAGN|nr:hypothetical protein IFM89_013355 [Coptis chinensis]